MNKVDVKNLNAILEWRELERKVKAGPIIADGGDFSFNDLVNLTDKELQNRISNFEKIEKTNNANRLRKLVNKFFEKYGTESSNMIVLSGAYYPDDSDCRYVYEREDIINDIYWDGFGRKYNKLYYPCAVETLPAGDWQSTNKLPEEERKSVLAQWDKYYKDLRPIHNLVRKLGVPTAEKYYRDDSSALNEIWYGVIGIMKDYRVVSFVIRNDGMLCDEDSYESCHNSIISKF